jgi:hypothetical protein
VVRERDSVDAMSTIDVQPVRAFRGWTGLIAVYVGEPTSQHRLD